MATEELGTVFFGMLPNARAAEKTVISVVSAVWFPWFRPFRFGGFAGFGGFGRFVSVVSLVSVVSAVSFRSFRWFRWFRRFRFGGFVSLFRVLVHAGLSNLNHIYFLTTHLLQMQTVRVSHTVKTPSCALLDTCVSEMCFYISAWFL